MHSRKFPRLDEGMYDRNQSRSYQVSGKSYSKERVYERGERDHSPLSLDRARERELRDRDRDGRDRYYNRSSPDRSNSYKYSRSSSSRGNEYMEYRSIDRDRDRDRERERERDRLERPSRPLDRMDIAGTNGRGSLTSRSKDSYGRVSPHEHPAHRASSSSSTTNHHGGTSTLASTVVPRSRDPAPCTSASTTSQSSRPPGSGSSFPAASSSSASSSNRTTEAASGTSGGSTTAATADIPKKALRVSGDWSEYVSSSGKRYYYNCKTEVSQWEKPKDWHAPPAPPETKAQPASGGKYVSSAVTAPHHRTREEVDTRESRPASGAASATRPSDIYAGTRDYPRDSSSAAPRYASRESSPSASRYSAASGRDREKEAREASQHVVGHSTEIREIVRDPHGREARYPPSDPSKNKDVASRSSASMSSVFRAGSKRPATSPNAKERSVSPDRVGRHGSRGFPTASADSVSRSRPRGDDRTRPPIASVVASSSTHQQMDSEPSPPPREHEEQLHQHHRHRKASDGSPVRHVIESSHPHAVVHSNHVPPSSSGTNAGSSVREVVRERDRERDRDGNSHLHSHHHQHHSQHQSESRRSLDSLPSSSASNPLSRLGKTFHEGGGSSASYPQAPLLAASSSSGPTGHSISDLHHPSPHQTHHSSAAAALAQQPAVAAAAPQSGSAHSCPTSSDANLTTQQALQTLQQALIMAKGGKNSSGGEMPTSSAATASISHPSTSTTMSHASLRSNSGSNGVNAIVSAGSATSRLSPGSSVDDRNRMPPHQSSQALPFQSVSNAPSLSQTSLSLNSTTNTAPRTSGLASLGGGAGQLTLHSSSRETAPESRTSHTSIALSGIQALNNKLSAMTQISPSLAQYYKEDLIAHIMGWQADAVEKQASQIAAEGLNIGALNCTRVSGDLKAARSLVRVHDILSTLQEQRLKVVKAWMKDLDYFPHVAGIPFHPPSSSPNSVIGAPNGLPPPPHSMGSLSLTNGLTPFIPPPSSTGVGWGTPSSLPPILTPGLNAPAEPVLTSPTSSAAPPPLHSLPPALTSPPPPPPPSSAVIKQENIPSADSTANSSATTKSEPNSTRKERSLSSSNDSTSDPQRPPQFATPSSRRTSGCNDSVAGIKHKQEPSVRDLTPIDSEEKNGNSDSLSKTKLKIEVKTEHKTEPKDETELEPTKSTVSDVGSASCRSRSNSGDGKTTFQLRRDGGNETIETVRRENEGETEEEVIPASKRTKLNNGEAVKKDGNRVEKEGLKSTSESPPAEPGKERLIGRSGDVAGQSSDSATSSSTTNRRSASPIEECRPKMNLEDAGDAAAAVGAEGSHADNISSTELLPNGNLGDERLTPSPSTFVAT